jgi:WD40 repeat protein
VLTGEGWPFFIAELWNATTGDQLRAFSGHSSPVTSVAFSADGWSVLTGSDVVRLWDLTDVLGRLNTRRTELGIELQWHEGALQRATNVSGPWFDVSKAASPWTQSADGAGEFYRLKLRD